MDDPSYGQRRHSQLMRHHLAPRILSVAVAFTVAVGLSSLPLLGSEVAAASTTTKTVPEPSMEAGGSITASSCVRGPVCVVLGWNHHGNSPYLWAARWRDNTWTKLSAPPEGENSGMGASTISCTSTTWCMATGSNGLNPGNHPIAEELTGTHWTTLPVPVLKGSTDFSLYELHCQSKQWCVGVGSYVANKPSYSDAQFLVSEVWNGSTWRIVPIFSPRTYAPQIDPGMVAGGEHPTAAPQAISCVSKTFCVLAGFWTGVFVEEWNGLRWSKVAAPNAPLRPRYDSEFTGGTCVSTTFCVATGGYAVSNAAWRPLVEQWNGQSWRVATLPKLPQHYNGKPGFRLSQVSCASSNFCVASGNAGLSSPVLNNLQWNGVTWRYVVAKSEPRLTLVCLTKNECNLTDAA